MKRHTFLHRRLGMVEVGAGFSWPAFFFGSLWAAAMHMWLPEFFILFLADAGLWFMASVAEAMQEGGLLAMGLVISIACAFARGKWGNYWLAVSLERRGFCRSMPTRA